MEAPEHVPEWFFLLGLKHFVVDLYLFKLATIWVVYKVHTVAAGRRIAENLISLEVFKDKMGVLLLVIRIKAESTSYLIRWIN